jgi:hypothetical protein
MAAKPNNKQGKSAGGMDWGNSVRPPVDVGRNDANKDESDVSLVLVLCIAIMALTFVVAIPLLGMAYGDLKAMTDLAAEQYKIMKEETRKTRELRIKILSEMQGD